MSPMRSIDGVRTRGCGLIRVNFVNKRHRGSPCTAKCEKVPVGEDSLCERLAKVAGGARVTIEISGTRTGYGRGRWMD